MHVTQPFTCAYLANKSTRLMMLVEPFQNANTYYPILLQNGFRRSGEQIYRPDCEQCQECQSLRINVSEFILSRSQKRLLNKNQHFKVKISKKNKPEYFSLYQRYIDTIHKDGDMYPATYEQYSGFLASVWCDMIFIEIYDDKKLIAVSVTDKIGTLPNSAWSAVYCFYDPLYQSVSLGKFAILKQLALAKDLNIEYLYLGYYIKNCQKMNYKTQFNPHQRFINGLWLSFD
ncbi:arginyl-tRNA-protein transferase [Psychromonas sp. CNPT3]|nr:arginyl-tRNA-protein transferase [Psychromonas sp. CNPT3]